MKIQRFDWSPLKEALDATIQAMPEHSCEISKYVPEVVYDQPAKHVWGYCSMIEVCATHAKWNPMMLEGGECPDCGKLADHDPCNADADTKHRVKETRLGIFLEQLRQAGVPASDIESMRQNYGS